MIPLILKLKKTAHKEIAKTQDIVVETLYEVFDRAVLHGGTAIWRCYNGKRFSEDIDVYIPKEIKKIDNLFEILKKKGFIIEKKKVGKNSLYSSLKIDRINVRFEALFRKIKGSLNEYETVEGNFLAVYTLKREELIKEKILAYLARLKIRDLYDIFFLLQSVENILPVRENLIELINKFKKPLDENELRILIFEGLAPDSGSIIDYIKRRTKYGQTKIS